MPELAPYVSETPSPMVLAARLVKEADANAVTVFAGPCIAKRKEGLEVPEVDYVLTFEELGAMFVAGKVDVAECDDAAVVPDSRAVDRGFAASGGVLAAVQEALGSEKAAAVQGEQLDGLDRKAITRLKMYARKGIPGNFMEVMACAGGCVAGPRGLVSAVVSKRELDKQKD